MDFRNQRVTVVGLGRHGGGVAAARFLAEAGADVTVTDCAAAADLEDSRAELADAPIRRWALGGHVADDFCGADLLVVNPAVRRDHPLVRQARERGVSVTSEIEIFLRSCPAKVVGVTGSNGKSTTAAMLAAILQADGRRVWLGGNIGRSLLPDLGQIATNDWVVLELSSFQLAWLNADAPLPHVAVITNCTPNHLDWHLDRNDYRNAKQRLLQCPTVVLNPHDAEVARWPTPAAARLASPVALAALPELKILGKHNRINAACAASAALAVDCAWSSIERALADYRGLPHRLELVAEVAGRRFFNDSMATTPESVIAALEALDQPIWLLAGGKDKGADFASLAQTIVRRVRGVCFYGQAREILAQQVSHACPAAAPPLVQTLETLPAALDWCWRKSHPGDAILLSPGCSSYDQFRDYRHRAAVFCEAVRRL